MVYGVRGPGGFLEGGLEEARLHGLEVAEPVGEAGGWEELRDALLRLDSRDAAGALLVEPGWRSALAVPGHRLLVEALRWAASRLDLDMVAGLLAAMAARAAALELPATRRHAVALEVSAVLAEKLWEGLQRARRGPLEDEVVVRLPRRPGAVAELIGYLELAGAEAPDGLEVSERGAEVEVRLAWRRRADPDAALAALGVVAEAVLRGLAWPPPRRRPPGP